MLVRECASASLPSPSPLHCHPTITRISATHFSSCSRTALAIITTRSSRGRYFTSHSYRSSASSYHCSIRSETFASVATALLSNFISHSPVWPESQTPLRVRQRVRGPWLERRRRQIHLAYRPR